MAILFISHTYIWRQIKVFSTENLYSKKIAYICERLCKARAEAGKLVWLDYDEPQPKVYLFNDFVKP